ncbi:DUF72 domain-containing protein [Persephonella sp. KM09-Lau-8]|uniref:DUF72 domain-containing protein n=1 Tax=Persephonella sp. KM09-Lau-8 TaxID=1158345 RepID=UPI000494F996|nr:DUF72 domain-containing protein [Persephonella sp. KM09-Lau-8]
MDSFIGTSGFFYWGWKGKFYPAELKPSQWFEFYASKFNTVEINSTFYNFPKKSNLKRWYKISPENFLFSVKVSKQITHIKRLKDTKQKMEDFYSIVSEALGEKLGAILFQMPPSFKYSEENLSRILDIVNPQFTNVFEFRHKSWWNEEVFKILGENNIVFCSISAPKLPEIFVKNTDISYIRFHGKTNWYKYKYSIEELTEWVKNIKTNPPDKLFVYFNNDYYGYAPENAQQFKDLLNK